jgi:hypothetical protein
MGADLKLIEASREVAHAGSHALLVRGMGELQSQAEWHISPGDESLHGDNQFLMVVERPSNSPATCEVEVGITLTRRMRGMTFLAQLPDEARRLVLA